MSLFCYECGQDLEPSIKLPGKEGVVIYPNLVTLIYIPLEDSVKYERDYLEAGDGAGLCFVCLEGSLSFETQQDILWPIYGAYKTEMEAVESKQLRREQEWILLLKEFEERSKDISRTCIFCSNDVKDYEKPFFTAKLVDRVRSPKTHAGVYSLAVVKSSLSLKMCYDDFAKRFHRTCLSISNRLFSR